MRNWLVSILAGAGAVVLATAAMAAEPTEVERVQAALDAWLAARAPIEKVTGISKDFQGNPFVFDKSKLTERSPM